MIVRAADDAQLWGSAPATPAHSVRRPRPAASFPLLINTPSRLLAIDMMVCDGRYFLDSFPRNSLPLLARQRMLGGLQLDLRADSHRLRVHLGFQAGRFRVARDGARKPAEVGVLLLPSRRFP